MKNILKLTAVVFMLFAAGARQADSYENPLNIKLWTDKNSDPSSGALKINYSVTSAVPISSIKVSASSVLGGSIVKPSEITLDDFEKYQGTTMNFSLNLGSGKSYVVVSVMAFDSKGKFLFGKNKKLYLLWDGMKLYQGYNGFEPVVFEKLDQELKEGKITGEQFDGARKALLGR